MPARPAVLMTDPRHYAIRGGANPHTRHADDSLKVVELERAWPQWHAYVDALLLAGVDVYVVDAQEGITGMVFAANAGFLPARHDQTLPLHRKAFYASHFTAPHRVPEQALFEDFLRAFGVDVRGYDASLRFEGEADAFPVGQGDALRWIFTYGFRSDLAVADWLEREVLDQPLERLRLTNPAYYHGDCLLCDLGGPFLVWTGGLDPQDAAGLQARLGSRVVALDDQDAAAFVGNSFYVETDLGRWLFSPAGIAQATRQRIQALGVRVVPVDISEFFGKGGGGPKCMVFNLGLVDPQEPGLSDAQRAWRAARDVRALRAANHFPA